MTSADKRYQATQFLLAFVAVWAYADPAWAANSVGDMFCNAFRNSGDITVLMSGFAYLTGGTLAIRGIFDLIKRSSDPNHPLRNGLLGIMAGGMVASLPSLIGWLHRTIYGPIVYHNVNGCVPEATAGPAGAVPLDEMLINFVKNINEPIIALISAMSIILGVIMIFYNMVKLSKFGADAQTNKLTPILASLIIGAMLVAIGHSVDVSLNTLFGAGTPIKHYESLAYAPGGAFNMDRFNNAMRAVFVFLYIIGALSFLRGFLILKNALEGQGQATKGQAFTHIIGGTLLINMPGFIEFIENTTGINIINVS
jgi:hypothetical protein